MPIIHYYSMKLGPFQSTGIIISEQLLKQQAEGKVEQETHL